MGITRKTVRFVLSVLVGLVVLPVGGQFFVSWADEKGWYKNPSDKVSGFMTSSMTLLNDIATAQWFHWTGGVVIGLAVGVWGIKFFPDKPSVLDNEDERETIQRELPVKGPSGGYALSLSNLDIIQDENSDIVDLSIGLVIRNTTPTVIKFEVDKIQVDFNGNKGTGSDQNFGGGVIRSNTKTIYNYRAISQLKKEDKIINAVVTYSIRYGEVNKQLTRRWSSAIRFPFNPTRLSDGYRYTIDFDRDEEIV